MKAEANEPYEAINDPVPQYGHDLPTRLLRWVELRGLAHDHGWLRQTEAEDAWWVESCQEVTGPHRFDVVLGALRDGASPIQIAHGSIAPEEAAQWRTLQYRPFWSNPAALFCWRIALSFFGTLLVFMALGIFAPSEILHRLNAGFLPLTGLLFACQFVGRLQPLMELLKRGVLRLRGLSGSEEGADA